MLHNLMNLLPCPFCGTTQLLLGHDQEDNGQEYHFIQCLQCNASIEDHPNQGAVAAQWNKRVIPLSQPLPN